MLKRVGIVVAILVVTFLTGLIFQFRPRHEPSYKGKPLHYWVDPWVYGGQESPQDVTAALNAMQNRAIPYLMEKLRWKPSPIMLKLHEQFPKFPLFMRYV